MSSNSGGGGGVAGSQPMRTAVHITWHGAQINCGDLTPYLIHACAGGGHWGLRWNDRSAAGERWWWVKLVFRVRIDFAIVWIWIQKELYLQKSVMRIRIRDPMPFWPLEPGSGMVKKSGSGFGVNINNTDHISESLNNFFFGLKYWNSFMWIRDPRWENFGSGIRNGKKSDPG
jgi:hypothetical protein